MSELVLYTTLQTHTLADAHTRRRTHSQTHTLLQTHTLTNSHTDTHTHTHTHLLSLTPFVQTLCIAIQKCEHVRQSVTRVQGVDHFSEAIIFNHRQRPHVSDEHVEDTIRQDSGLLWCTWFFPSRSLSWFAVFFWNQKDSMSMCNSTIFTSTKYILTYMF